MAETQTHYKKNLDPNWIGTYVLPDGKDIVVKLLKVTFEKNLKVAGKAKNSHVAYFDKNPHFDKPMLLNPTNCKRLSMLFGTPIIEKWANMNVTLCQEMDKCVTGGQDWALRIRAEKPALPTLTVEMAAFPNVVDYVRKGGLIEDIEKRYVLTPEIKQTILNESKHDA